MHTFMSERRIVIDTFSITGRGTVVLLDCLLRLPAVEVGIRVTPPDGGTFECVGYVETVCRRSAKPVESTGISVRDLSKDRFPVGSTVEILVARAHS